MHTRDTVGHCLVVARNVVVGRAIADAATLHSDSPPKCLKLEACIEQVLHSSTPGTKGQPAFQVT